MTYLSEYDSFLCSKCQQPVGKHQWEKDKTGQWILTKVNEQCPNPVPDHE